MKWLTHYVCATKVVTMLFLIPNLSPNLMKKFKNGFDM